MLIDLMLFIYIAICMLLLVYSLIYTWKSKIIKKKMTKMKQKWKVLLDNEFENLRNGQHLSRAHMKYLEKKLPSINQFIAYISALDSFKEDKLMPIYLKERALSQQYLAYKYLKKDDISRSFFAYAISLYPPNARDEYLPILEVLIEYMDDASITCRENVLRALYAIGNVYAIETALEFINNHHLFHHPKLLADGLATFQGNKEELMRCLWKHINDWDAGLMVSIVNFIALSSSEYKSIFLPYLTDESVSLEIRLEILRYYRKHYYEPVQDILCSFLTSHSNVNLSIVSATVLASYPSKRTTEVLKNALCHSNWYVRYNAAGSLLKMDHYQDEINDILHGNDTYAKEILIYMMEQEGIYA